MSGKDDLLRLRAMLEPLAESFELDEPDQGLVAWIPVVGGTFVHPLSRAAIPRLKVYGAGPDRVKIVEPRFMRSLPTVPVAGLTHPSQLCAVVARMMGEALGELGRIRDTVAGMGITLDLEHDVLRLRGQVELQGILVELTTSRPGELTLSALGRHPLSALEGQDRVLRLSGQPAADLDELAKLVRSLDDRIRREALEQMEVSLGLFAEGDDASGAAQVTAPASGELGQAVAGESAGAPAPQPSLEAGGGSVAAVGLGSGWGELIPGAESDAGQGTGAPVVAHEQAPMSAPEPEPVVEPEPEPVVEPEPEPVVEPEPEPVVALEPEPVSVPEPGLAEALAPVSPDSALDSPAERAPRFAEGTSDVVELTELVEEVGPVTEAPAISPDPARLPGAQASAPPPAATGPIVSGPSIDDLFAPGKAAAAPSPERAAEPAEPAKARDDVTSPAGEFPPLRIDYLFEATGGDTEISAHQGRLRLKIPFRVVQGEYTFYLEQVGHKQFNGFLVSASGTRHKVEVDFTAIMDIKEIFDKVMLG